jgi:hypothetical protein
MVHSFAATGFLSFATQNTRPEKPSKQFPDGIPEYTEMPQPRIKDRTENQDPYFQEIEIDPEVYYPRDMLRECVLELPDLLRPPNDTE